MHFKLLGNFFKMYLRYLSSLFFCFYRLRPNNNCIIVKHLRYFRFIMLFFMARKNGCGIFCVCQTCPWRTDPPKWARYAQYFHRLEGSSTSKYKIFKIYLDKSSIREATLDLNWILHICRSLKNNYRLTLQLNSNRRYLTPTAETPISPMSKYPCVKSASWLEYVL